MTKKGARFSDVSTTKRICADWWEKDQYVEIRKFSYGDQRNIETASMTLKSNIAKSKAFDAEIHSDAMQMKTLMLGIKSWNFDDAAGNSVRVQESTLRNLNLEDGEFILAEIQEYNKRRVTKEQVDEAIELLDEERAKGSKADPDLIELMEENVKELEDALQLQGEEFPETETSSQG